MKIVFATGNKGKLREASEILGVGFELVTPADFGITEDIPETGNTLRANSLQKAQYLFDNCGCDCFADDTGLEVDALGGAPGVYTARYAGEGKDFNANMDKVLYEISHAIIIIGKPVPRPNITGNIQFHVKGRVIAISTIVKKYTNRCGQKAIAKKIPNINDQKPLLCPSIFLSHLLIPWSCS